MIFYFSATGNSLYVAEQIAGHTNDTCVSIPQAMQEQRFSYTLEENEPLGLVMPVYFWGIPMMVHDFLSKLEITNEQRPYTYLVFTCGGSSCNASRFVRQYLTVDFIPKALVMPDNYIVVYDVAHKYENQRRLENMKKPLSDIISRIRNRHKDDTDPNAGPLAFLQTKVAYPIYQKGRETDKFWSDEKCISCGYCQEICTDQIITLVDGHPVWNAERCQLCLACIHRCPEKAIQYGNKTAQRGRYTHPFLAAREQKQREPQEQPALEQSQEN